MTYQMLPKDVQYYKCPYCGTMTYEGDRNHYRWWDSQGGHCTRKG